jgi:hypothetical protein
MADDCPAVGFLGNNAQKTREERYGWYEENVLPGAPMPPKKANPACPAGPYEGNV